MRKDNKFRKQPWTQREDNLIAKKRKRLRMTMKKGHWFIDLVVSSDWNREENGL